jgi:hypothetical protein
LDQALLNFDPPPLEFREALRTACLGFLLAGRFGTG